MVTYRRLVNSLGLGLGTPQLNSTLTAITPIIDLAIMGGRQAYVAYKREGLRCSFDWNNPDWTLTSITLFAEGIDGFSQFPDLIEGVISLPATQAHVRAAFGKPSRTRAGGNPWDEYDRELYSVRFDFNSKHGLIRTATLITHDAVCPSDWRASTQAVPLGAML